VKVIIETPYAYFYSISRAELDFVRNKLTWEVGYGKDKEEKSLLFYDEDTKQFYTYFGLIDPLGEATKKFKIEVTERDDQDGLQRYDVRSDLLQDKELFGFQCAAVEKCLMLKRGIVKVPTSGGKTLITATLYICLLQIYTKIENILMIVPTTALADQFKSDWIDYGLDEDMVGVIHGKRKEYGFPITVATSKTIVDGLKNKRKPILLIVKKAQGLIMDEGQHLKSDSWTAIAKASQHCDYMIALSGTPFQNDDVLKEYGDAVVCGLIGGVIFETSYAHLRELDLTAEPFVHFMKTKGAFSKSKAPFVRVYNKYIVKDVNRNKKIVQMMWKLKRMGFPVLTLVQRKEHAIDLLNKLNDPDALCIFGNGKSVQQDQYGQLQEVGIDYEQFRGEFERGKWSVAIASQVFDEGISIPSIGVLINGGAGRSRIKVAQRTGRGLRKKKEGLNRVFILDFNDRGHVYLASHSKKRREFYESIDANLVDEDEFWLAVFEAVKELNEEWEDDDE